MKILQGRFAWEKKPIFFFVGRRFFFFFGFWAEHGGSQILKLGGFSMNGPIHHYHLKPFIM